jgi:hypothetical protein
MKTSWEVGSCLEYSSDEMIWTNLPFVILKEPNVHYKVIERERREM